MLANILSVDVEDYFHVEAFAGVIERKRWDSFSCRVEPNTMRILDIFDEYGVKATFFILGWVAERYPGLVREIVNRGHEPACHSYWHRLVYSLSPEEFREDTRRAKDCIEQSGGAQIYGYRAPSYSVTAKSLWALDVLADLGFAYDSSIFPVHHDVYGIPTAPRVPFLIATPSGPIVEYPISTFKFGKQNLPVGGGGYLRMLPGWYTRAGISRLQQEHLPLIVYLHPWEIDPDQPRIQAPWKSRLRHYKNLNRMEARLRMVLSETEGFTTFSQGGLDRSAKHVDMMQETLI